MREIVIDTGGRKLLNDDLEGIQDHILALQSIFVDEDPFILSGVNLSFGVNGINISNGYVWLGGKIRFFSGASDLNLRIDTYINVEDTDSRTLYGDGIIRTSKSFYGATLSTTNMGLNSLTLVGGGRRYSDVNDSKFLNLNSANTQTIFSELIINGGILFTDSLSITNTVTWTDLRVHSLSVQDFDVTNALLVTVNNDSYIAEWCKSSSISIFGGAGIISNLGFAANTVNENSIEDGAVTEDKIFNNSVTEDKIFNGSVTTGKFEDGAVTTDKILAGTLMDEDFDSHTIESSKFQEPIVQGFIGSQNASLRNTDLDYVSVNHNLKLVNPEEYVYLYNVYITDDSEGTFVTGSTFNVLSNSFQIPLDSNADSNTGVDIQIKYLILKIN